MIAIAKLVYAYSGSKELHFPDFNVGQGQQCLLLGESGSGKTTLLKGVGESLTAFVMYLPNAVAHTPLNDENDVRF